MPCKFKIDLLIEKEMTATFGSYFLFGHLHRSISLPSLNGEPFEVKPKPRFLRRLSKCNIQIINFGETK